MTSFKNQRDYLIYSARLERLIYNLFTQIKKFDIDRSKGEGGRTM